MMHSALLIAMGLGLLYLANKYPDRMPPKLAKFCGNLSIGVGIVGLCVRLLA